MRPYRSSKPARQRRDLSNFATPSANVKWLTGMPNQLDFIRRHVPILAPQRSRRREILRRLARRRPADPVTWRWHRWASRNADVFFVQIGSNDGFAGDPLEMYIDQHRGWRGILVEPIPETFLRLEQRRTNHRFQLVQAAVTDHDGNVAMHVIDSTIRHTSELATLDEAVALSHRSNIDDFSTHVVDVPAVTFATLTYGVADIDVLHVDTEGHDARILAQVDFDRWTLRAVLYEHRHLSASDRASTVKLLRARGFRVWSNASDALGLR